MRDEEKKPKAAESESFSLSKPKQIEDVMDDIATDKPESSSEFDSMNEELKKRLAHGEKIRHENVKFIWDSSHARDAEEIARLRKSYEGLGADYEKLYSDYASILNSGPEKHARTIVQKLTEENQRLRDDLAHANETCKTFSDENAEWKLRIEKLTGFISKIATLPEAPGDFELMAEAIRKHAREALAEEK